ncbi:glycoside hydrolase [Anaeromyces robustus]|uniref:mannan endo-1,4-beta-mannosidase n=1 Tax=Anaeromyces robustus TaxID=1754192 RepID=A0A1Y1WIY5_9FUNG|nr:glycoside hydrolase [Anaeromyces robustus]|eukprot:ORX73497.1 glycoside hydrolase [Anaeromyces robustus]
MVNFSKIISSLALLAAPAVATIGGYVYTEGTNFYIDGKKIYFSGTNTYFLHSSQNERVDLALEVSAKHNLQVVRAWAFCDYNGCGDKQFVKFENGKAIFLEDNMESIDYFIAAASQRNIRLVLAFTNNWTDYGGMDAWVKGLGGKYHDDFYTDKEIRKTFKSYIKTIVTRINRHTNIRYSDDPTIFSWQLANEPRCGDGPSGLPQSGKCTPEVITEWANDISSYIKELDKNHLVSVGCEGFGLEAPSGSKGLYAYKYEEGTDFETLTALPNIDYNTYHYYPIPWGMTDLIAHTKDWIEAHQAVGKKLNKPVVFEEWGLETPKDCSKEERIQYYKTWTKQILDADVPMNMFWYTVGADYYGTDNYILKEDELTESIDPFTEAMLEKSDYQLKTKSIGRTDLPSIYWKVEGCGDLWSQCSNLSTQPGVKCCCHGCQCVSHDDLYAQCKPRAPDYRNSTIPDAVEIERLPGGSAPVTPKTTTTSGSSPTSDTSCFSIALNYPCCQGNNVVYIDDDGEWGYENNNWCGIGKGKSESCTGKSQGYPCCSSCDVIYTDGDGNWGVENNEWCGIKDSC